MMKLKLMMLFLLAMLLAIGMCAPAVSAQKKAVAGQHKDRFRNIEVAPFEVKEGVDFPREWLNLMTEQMMLQLKDTGKFKQILRPGETPAEAAEPVLKLSGTVITYKAGSRAKRYWVGFGAGKTVIKAHIKVVDRATGELLFEDDVDGKVVMGVFGGESEGATRGLAKEIAAKTKKEFFTQ